MTSGELCNLSVLSCFGYEQDGKGEEAIVTLHYFRGGMDWFITEKDMEPEQHQAFGLADLGTLAQAKKAATFLEAFISPRQLKSTLALCCGEEGQYFIDKLVELANTIQKMPKTYWAWLSLYGELLWQKEL